MRLSAKSRYAITAMLTIAFHESQEPVTLSYLSVKQNISIFYLEQIFATLRAHGLVRGLRGPGGGYRLARKRNDISIRGG